MLVITFVRPVSHFVGAGRAEEPPGTFHGLVDGGVYWVYVSRDDEEEKQDRERMKQARNMMTVVEFFASSRTTFRRPHASGRIQRKMP